jgi:HAD superfamily hydrolase (TIGR01509 family)
VALQYNGQFWRNEVIRAILFDIDGTLLLSNDAHARSWHEAFIRYGYNIPVEAIRPLMGMGGDKLVPTLAPDLQAGEGTGHDISNYRKKLVLGKYVQEMKPSPGARDLVQYLQQQGYQTVVATSAAGEELEALLNAAGVNDLFAHTATADDAERSKPDPDIIHAALTKADAMPSQAIMVGDSPYDIAGAGHAGVEVIALRCGGFSDGDLQGATAIFNDPADLLRSRYLETARTSAGDY